MIKQFTLALTLLSSATSFSYSQEKSQTDRGSLKANANEIAQFPGGDEAFREFMMDRLRYTTVPFMGDSIVEVTVQFEISDSGSISDIEIVKGSDICPECNFETIRILSFMPNWIPTKHNGTPINSVVSLHISYPNLLSPGKERRKEIRQNRKSE